MAPSSLPDVVSYLLLFHAIPIFLAILLGYWLGQRDKTANVPIHPQSYWRLPGIGVVQVVERVEGYRDHNGCWVNPRIKWVHVSGASSDATESDFRRGAALVDFDAWAEARIRKDIEQISA
jgi:hypothetical protein